jgi:hypothetical protein
VTIIDEFVRSYGRHDWEALGPCFADDGFERIGPYTDRIEGKREYLDFLRRVVPTLKDNYELRCRRVSFVGERLAFAELVECLEIDQGTVTEIPEVIVFDLNDEGLIRRMHLYLQNPRGEAPVGGEESMGIRE